MHQNEEGDPRAAKDIRRAGNGAADLVNVKEEARHSIPGGCEEAKKGFKLINQKVAET